MPTEFLYKARDLDGTGHSGAARMESEEAVRDFLASRSLIPISIRPRSQNAVQRAFKILRRRSAREDLILFTRKLNALYRAGVPITNALGIIADQETDRRFAQLADQLRLDLEQGYSFSEAVGQHLDVFDETYVSAVRIAEDTGRTDVVLDKLAASLERDLETREQVKTAVRYPIIVIVLVTAAFFALVTLVVPRFVEFYSRNRAELPLPTNYSSVSITSLQLIGHSSCYFWQLSFQ